MYSCLDVPGVGGALTLLSGSGAIMRDGMNDRECKILSAMFK